MSTTETFIIVNVSGATTATAGLVLAGLLAAGAALPAMAQDTSGAEPEAVTVDTYIRADTDYYFQEKADAGAFGKFLHYREAPSLDKQLVIRMNRDTLYSYAILDLSEPAVVVKPDSGDRFQSMVVLNQDHYIKLVAYDPGEYELTQDEFGTRYIHIAVRTFADPGDPEDMKAAHALQDALEIRQRDPGELELPNWNQEQLAALRKAVLGLVPFVSGSRGMFGDVDEVEPVRRLIGTAGGWGGNRYEDAIYLPITPEKSDGETPYVLTLGDVPVDGFWSISVYNADGYFEKNPQDAYSVNSVTAERDADGRITVHFGGDPDQPNFLAIMPGWNYTVRLYRPRQELIDGTWEFPSPQPAN